MTTQTVKQLINGEFVESTTSEWIDLSNPATQQVIAKVPKLPPMKSTKPSRRRQKRSKPGAKPRLTPAHAFS